MGESDEGRSEGRRRRTIYLLLFLLVAVALLLPFGLELPAAQEAVECFETVEGLPDRARVFLVADYASTGDRAEPDRQARALVAHVLRKGARLVVLSTRLATAQAVDVLVREALAERGQIYGEAAVHLGARDGGINYVFSCATDFVRGAEGQDHRGEDLTLMSVVHGFRWLGDGNLLIWVGDATGLPMETAASLAAQQGVLSIAAGSGTAGARALELARDGRVSAGLAGGTATADYESLYAGRASAARHRLALTLGTLFVLGLIVWAYISGLLGRRPRRMDGGV